jgi:hypothetical protein
VPDISELQIPPTRGGVQHHVPIVIFGVSG